MRGRKPIAAVLVLSMLLCGCVSSPADPAQSQSISSGQPQTDVKTISSIPFTLAAYPGSSFHPLTTENRTNLTLAPLLYEGLFALDDTFSPVNLLCRSAQREEGGLVWRFVLQPGVTFSDGTPLTGQLVADVLRRAAGAGSNYAQRLKGVVLITGNETTVTITLSAPNGALPALLDIPIVLGEGDRPLGTGPYVLTGEGDAVSLSQREGWWQGLDLPVGHIPLAPVRQPDDLTASFDAGNISLLNVDLMGTNALGYSGNYEVWEYSTTTLIYLGVNTRTGACTDGELRRMISGAIDRQAIVSGPYAGHAQAAQYPVHPAAPLYPKLSPPGAGEAFTPPAKPLCLVVSSENSSRLAAGRSIAAQLGELGLAVEVEALPWESYLAALSRREFDLYLAEVALTADFDPGQLISVGGGLNYGGWASEDTEELLALFRSAADGERKAAADSLYAHLGMEAPIIPVCFKNGSVLTQWGKVSGLAPVQRNVFQGFSQWSIS